MDLNDARGIQRKDKKAILMVNNKVYPIFEGLNTIGRSKTATVIIKNPNVSQQQAIITVFENNHFLSELNSSNGTFLKNNRLPPLKLFKLEDNDIIKFADCVCIYRKDVNTAANQTQSIIDSFYTAHTQPIESQVFGDTFYERDTQLFDRSQDSTTSRMVTQPSHAVLLPVPEAQNANASTNDSTIHEMATQLFCRQIGNEVEIVSSEEATQSYELNLEEQQIDIPTTTGQTVITPEIENAAVSNIQAEISTRDTSAIGDSHMDIADDEVSNGSLNLMTVNNEVYLTEEPLQEIDSHTNDTENVPGCSYATERNKKTLADSGSETDVDEELQKLNITPQTKEDSGSEDKLHLSQLKKKPQKSMCIGSDDETDDDLDIENQAKCNKLVKDNGNSATESKEDSSESEEKLHLSQLKNKPHKSLCINSDDETNIADDEASNNSLNLMIVNAEIDLIEQQETDSRLNNTGNGPESSYIADRNENKMGDSGSDTDADEELQKLNITLQTKEDSESEEKLHLSQLKNKRQKYICISSDDEVNVENQAKCNNSEVVTDNDNGATETKEDSESEGKLHLSQLKSKPHNTLCISSDNETDDEIQVDNQNKCNYSEDVIDDSVLAGASQNVTAKRNSTANILKNPGNKQLNFSNNSKLNDTDVIPATQDAFADGFCFEYKTQDLLKSATHKNIEAVKYSEATEDANSEDSFKLELSESIPDSKSQSKSRNCSQDVVNTGVRKKYTDSPKTTAEDAEIIESRASTSKGVADIYYAATQMLVINTNTNGSETDNEPNEASTSSKDDPSASEKTAAISSDLLKASEEIFAAPTQKIPTHSRSESLDLLQELDDVFAAPTQVVPIQKKTANSEMLKESDEEFAAPTQRLSMTQGNDDSVFLRATQKLTDTSRCNENIKNRSVDEDSIFDIPTQRIALSSNSEREQDTEELFAAATQPLTTRQKEDDVNSSSEPVLDDFFLKPSHNSSSSKTMKREKPEIKQQLENELTENDGTERDRYDIYEQATQKLSEATSPVRKENQNSEIESQLEVMFASQNVRYAESVSSRPQNPLVNVLENEPDFTQEEGPSTSKKQQNRNGKEIVEIDETEVIDGNVNSENTNFDQPRCNEVVNEQATDDPEMDNTTNTVLSKVKENETSEQTKKAKDVKVIIDRMAVNSDSSSKKVASSSDQPSSNEITNEQFIHDLDIDNAANTVSSKVKKNETSRQTKKAKNVKVIIDRMSVNSDSSSKKVASSSDQPRCSSNQVTNEQVINDIERDNIANSVPSKVKINETSGQTNKMATRGTRDVKVIVDKITINLASSSKKVLSKSKNKNETDIEVENIVLDNSEPEDQEIRDANKDKEKPTMKTRKRVKPVSPEQVTVAVTKALNGKTTKNTSRNKAKISKPQNESSGRSSSQSSSTSGQTDLEVDTAPSTTTRGKRKAPKEQTRIKTVATPPARKRGKVETSTPLEIDNTTESVTETAVLKRSNRIKRPSTRIEPSTPVKQTKRNGQEIGDRNFSNAGSSVNQTPVRRKQIELNDSSVLSTPERSKRKLKPKVVFTMLNSPELESMIRHLGGSIVDTVDACTVLVTESVKRSQKLLMAVGQGKPICSPSWIRESKKANHFLDPWDHILSDKEAERKWDFSLKESLIRGGSKNLLENYVVQLMVTTAADVLKGAVEACGGKLVTRAPGKRLTGQHIIVSSPENKTKYSKLLKQPDPPLVVDAEAILDGVLRQELHFNDHLLS